MNTLNLWYEYLVRGIRKTSASKTQMWPAGGRREWMMTGSLFLARGWSSGAPKLKNFKFRWRSRKVKKMKTSKLRGRICAVPYIFWIWTPEPFVLRPAEEVAGTSPASFCSPPQFNSYYQSHACSTRSSCTSTPFLNTFLHWFIIHYNRKFYTIYQRRKVTSWYKSEPIVSYTLFIISIQQLFGRASMCDSWSCAHYVQCTTSISSVLLEYAAYT